MHKGLKMSEKLPPEPSENNPPPPAPRPNDWRDERDQWRAQRREWRAQRRAARRSGGGAWIGGAVLILLGVIFLLQNFAGFALRNWWALFILIPAVIAFGNAINSFQAAGGRLSPPARGSLIGGLVLTLIALAFLFDFTSSLFWPILLIVLGLGLLLNVFLPS